MCVGVKSRVLLLLVYLLPTFIIEGESKFQLEVSENKTSNFFLIQGYRLHEFYPQTIKGSMGTRLRSLNKGLDDNLTLYGCLSRAVSIINNNS